MRRYSLWAGRRFLGVFLIDDDLVECLQLEGYSVVETQECWGEGV